MFIVTDHKGRATSQAVIHGKVLFVASREATTFPTRRAASAAIKATAAYNAERSLPGASLANYSILELVGTN